MIQHIVLFTPKRDLSVSSRRDFAVEVARTLRDCPHAKRCVVGRRTTIDPGYTRVFGDKTYEYTAVIDFEDAAALLDYLNHPSHAALGRLFWESCENAVVCEVSEVDLRQANAVSLLVE